MTIEKLENHLGHTVKIKLFDGDNIEGYLIKTGDSCFKNNPNLFIPKNYYVLTDSEFNSVSCIFKASHIVKMICLECE